MTTNSHEKVVWLDVAMNEGFAMHKFDAGNHLVGQHEHRFQSKPTIAEGEQILQRRPKQFKNQNVVSMFLSTPLR